MELVINDFVIIPKLRGRAGEKKKKSLAVHTRENENRSVMT